MHFWSILVAAIMAFKFGVATPIYNVWPGSPRLGFFYLEVGEVGNRSHVPVKATGGRLWVTTNDTLSRELAPNTVYGIDLPAIMYTDSLDPGVPSNIYLHLEGRDGQHLYIAEDGSLRYNEVCTLLTDACETRAGARPEKVFMYTQGANDQGVFEGKKGYNHFYACPGTESNLWNIMVGTVTNGLDGIFKNQCLQVVVNSHAVIVFDLAKQPHSPKDALPSEPQKPPPNGPPENPDEPVIKVEPPTWTPKDEKPTPPTNPNKPTPPTNIDKPKNPAPEPPAK